MTFKKIVMLGFSDALLDSEHWQRLDSLGNNIVKLGKDSQNIVEELRGADCLLSNIFAVPITREFIDAAPNLRYIGVYSTAYGKAEPEYAKTKNIPICNIPGFSTEAVAEFAIGAILEYIRDLERSKQLAREGDFSEVPKFPIYEIMRKNFGVIGLGRIGYRIAELALAFGANVYYWSRNRKPEAEQKGIKYKDIDRLLAESDFLSINLPWNKDTNLFMNEVKIRKIKPGAIFVNLSPNELIDFSALESRLAKNDMVYIADHTDEMLPDLIKTLSNYKNCVLYPPLAFATKEARLNKQETFISNIESFLRDVPTNVVN
ncbi:MAG: hypothetical protein HY362_04550 [Candidatus Aenigmarchaeota archaeon]|nr:hypothetical protein [Candidatus Aenigmarchaeota archaeon]